MSFIEGVGDEVVAFAVVLFVFIFSCFITFLLNDFRIGEPNRQISTTPLTAPSQSPERRQSNCGDHTQNDDSTTAVDSNHNPSNVSNLEEEPPSATDEPDIADASDEIPPTNSTLYPDINECATPSAPHFESEENRENEERQSTDPDEIHVRLKYLDDTERTVTSNPRVKVGDFKRTHFVEEFASNKVVRLIFSGQLLRDNATLQSYAVANNCVIHVQILQAQMQQNPTSVSQNTDLDLSHLLWPLLSVILGICWILYFKYPEFFNLMSLGMLFLFTGSFIYFYSQIQHQ